MASHPPQATQGGQGNTRGQSPGAAPGGNRQLSTFPVFTGKQRRGPGLERATRYRLSFSSNMVGGISVPEKNDYCLQRRRCRIQGAGKEPEQNKRKQTQVDPPPRQLLSCSVKVLKLVVALIPHVTGYEDICQSGGWDSEMPRARGKVQGHQTTFTNWATLGLGVRPSRQKASSASRESWVLSWDFLRPRSSVLSSGM